MNSGYYPNVVSHRPKVQTEGQAYQPPFYFGGSQVPSSLHLQTGTFSGAGFSKDIPIKKPVPIQHQKGRYVAKPYKVPFI